MVNLPAPPGMAALFDMPALINNLRSDEVGLFAFRETGMPLQARAVALGHWRD